MTKFEERLWSLIRNFIELGHNNPAMLVAAVRIVEIQELVDKQLESSGRGTTHSAVCMPRPASPCLALPCLAFPYQKLHAEHQPVRAFPCHHVLATFSRISKRFGPLTQ